MAEKCDLKWEVFRKWYYRSQMKQLKRLKKLFRLHSPVVAALLLLGSPAAVLADKASDVAALEAQCEQERELERRPNVGRRALHEENLVGKSDQAGLWCL